MSSDAVRPDAVPRDDRPADGTESHRGFPFPRARRLVRGPELDVVRREGKRVRTEHLEVRVLASLSSFPEVRPPEGWPTDRAVGEAPARVGIIVPKHRHGSVARNGVKRRLRELVRLRLLPALDALGAPDVGLLLRANPNAYRATFDRLGRDVERATTQLRTNPSLLAPRPAPAPSTERAPRAEEPRP